MEIFGLARFTWLRLEMAGSSGNMKSLMANSQPQSIGSGLSDALFPKALVSEVSRDATFT
jgi:hypothetical protein